MGLLTKHDKKMFSNLADKTVLITGGTGSFGNRFGAIIRKLDPREIRIFSRDEKKQWEMERVFPDFRYFIGDVRDVGSLATAMEGVDYVFHAAALKQVPTCERFPLEAIRTNAIGAHNVCEVAQAAGVKMVVGLSTDKAVKPVNAMGISKALMEKLICTRNKYGGKTTFCCVRYGNVMGTRGSIIPLFKKLIKEGKPLTITVPEMTRFLLTLDQSVDLVLLAMVTGKGGEVFVHKAPACTVIDLGRAIASKYSPLGLEHEIVEIGIRSGEKIHEILVNEYEMLRSVEESDYFVIHPEYVDQPHVTHPHSTEYSSDNAKRITALDEIVALLDLMGEADLYI